MPENLRTRFRASSGSHREAALEAVVNPLKGTGRSFVPGVAETLIDNLVTIHVRPGRDAPSGRSDNDDADLLATASGLPSSADDLRRSRPIPGGYVATSEYVEPVQLQVVCQTLWSNLGADEAEITAEHLERCGDVNQALSRFYETVSSRRPVAWTRRRGRSAVVERAADHSSRNRGLVLREADKQQMQTMQSSLSELQFDSVRGPGQHTVVPSYRTNRSIEPVRNSNRR